MTMRLSRNSGLVLAALLVATALASGRARAQRDGAELPNAAALRAAQLLELEFLTERGDRQRNRTELREQFESALKSRLEKLDRRYGLSDGQRKKLMLAGHVEIKRHLDRLEELERKLSVLRDDADEYIKVLEEISRLDHVKSPDLFGEGSFFTKVLGSTLTKEQTTRYLALEQRLGAEHHRAALQWVLATWDETLGLNASQHERLQVLLTERTRPPRRFGTEDYFGVLWQVSRLPEPQWKSILREDQWAKLQPQIARARQMEAMLRQKGYLPDQNVVVVPAPANAPAANSERKQG